MGGGGGGGNLLMEWECHVQARVLYNNLNNNGCVFVVVFFLISIVQDLFYEDESSCSCIHVPAK